MWQRLSLFDVRLIGHYLGSLVMVSAGLMLVPFITGVAFHEWEAAARYLSAAGFAFAAGAAMRFLWTKPARLTRRHALIVTGLSWIVLAVFCSFPLYFSGHYATYLDALFEGVSGLTTTGASLAIDLDHMSNADNMFRMMMHLLGGLGLIVIALSLGIFGKRASSSLYSSEARSEHVVPNVVQTTQFIAKISTGIILAATVVMMVLCLLAGMEPVRAFMHALWLSISSFVTGGMTPMQQSVMYYHSFPLELVVMTLMLLGSISFVVYSGLWKGRVEMYLRDIETRTTVIWLVVMTAVFAAALSSSALFSDLPALLRRGLFMVVSSATTTGFQVLTTNQLTTVLTSGAFLILAILMAVGGSAGSTAGGVKMYRVGIIVKSIVSTIKEAISPDTARVVVDYNHMGRRVLTPEVTKEAMTIFTLYAVTYVIGALVGIAHGYDATQAIFESIAMTSNGGIITGLVTPGMPFTLELFYIFQMWAGRLEFVTLLALVAQIVVSIIPRKKAAV